MSHRMECDIKSAAIHASMIDFQFEIQSKKENNHSERLTYQQATNIGIFKININVHWNFRLNTCKRMCRALFTLYLNMDILPLEIPQIGTCIHTHIDSLLRTAYNWSSKYKMKITTNVLRRIEMNSNSNLFHFFTFHIFLFSVFPFFCRSIIFLASGISFHTPQQIYDAYHFVIPNEQKYSYLFVKFFELKAVSF